MRALQMSRNEHCVGGTDVWGQELEVRYTCETEHIVAGYECLGTGLGSAQKKF